MVIMFWIEVYLQPYQHAPDENNHFKGAMDFARFRFKHFLKKFLIAILRNSSTCNVIQQIEM